MLSTQAKESFLKQKGLVVWLIGLSGSGKSTLAKMLDEKLHSNGYYSVLLDGDNLRTGINNNLGFTAEDRTENIRRAAELSKLFAVNGAITICSMITPLESIRKQAKGIIGDKYYEVFVNCPLEVCEQRDVKGLYKKARNGEIENFTGITSPFETPKNNDLEVNTAQFSATECTQKIFDSLLQYIKL